MNFTQKAAQHPKPGRTITVPTWVWADTWSGKPDGPVVVGLRLLGNGDLARVVKLATQYADEKVPLVGHFSHEELWHEAYNNFLVFEIAALGICSAESVNAGPDVMKYAQDQIRYAMTPAGARWLFEQRELYEKQVSSIDPMLEDADADEFCAALKANLVKLRPSDRRLLAHVMASICE